MSFDGKSLTGAQLRAARALIRVSGEELAERTQLGLSTIRRAEAEDGALKLTRANAHLLVMALESLGVEFLAADKAGGPGVRLAKKAGGKRTAGG